MQMEGKLDSSELNLGVVTLQKIINAIYCLSLNSINVPQVTGSREDSNPSPATCHKVGRSEKDRYILIALKGKQIVKCSMSMICDGKNETQNVLSCIQRFKRKLQYAV